MWYSEWRGKTCPGVDILKYHFKMGCQSKGEEVAERPRANVQPSFLFLWNKFMLVYSQYFYNISASLFSSFNTNSFPGCFQAFNTTMGLLRSSDS